jgi:hypothetical protein
MMTIGCFVLYGTLFTWLCAAIGLRFFFTHSCSPGPRIAYAKSRVRAIERALTEYQLDWNDCPRPKDALIDGGYLDSRNFTDPWEKTISFRCSVDEDRVVSAGPDRIFGTADDVTNER